jgi:hypothetical protein
MIAVTLQRQRFGFTHTTRLRQAGDDDGEFGLGVQAEDFVEG